MNKKILFDMALEAGGSHYPEVGGKTLEKFAEIVVAECIIAVENTDTSHAYTTFDKDMIINTVAKCVDSIKRKFEI